jgi:hypothetical protein
MAPILAHPTSPVHGPGGSLRSRKWLTVQPESGPKRGTQGAGGMFLLWWNTFSGSYLAFTAASRE